MQEKKVMHLQLTSDQLATQFQTKFQDNWTKYEEYGEIN